MNNNDTNKKLDFLSSEIDENFMDILIKLLKCGFNVPNYLINHIKNCKKYGDLPYIIEYHKDNVIDYLGIEDNTIELEEEISELENRIDRLEYDIIELENDKFDTTNFWDYQKFQTFKNFKDKYTPNVINTC